MFTNKSNNDGAGMIFDAGYRQQYVENYMRESKCYTNVFNEKECTELSEFMFRKTKSWRTSSTGNLFFSGNFRTLVKDIIYPKLKDIIPNDIIDWTIIDNVAGNFFHTPHQYGIHTDMPEEQNSFDSNTMVYRSLLIPLYLLGPKQKKPLRMIWFNERIVDNGCTLDYGPDKSVTHYRSFSDYNDIENVYTLDGPTKIDPTNIMSNEEFEKHGLTEAPSIMDRYNGISVENSFEWTPGDVFVFDTAQVHSSTQGAQPFMTKAGLRISLITTRDYDKYK